MKVKQPIPKLDLSKHSNEERLPRKYNFNY